MQAFHSLWTKPFFARHPHDAFTLSPDTILTTALSALSFRRAGGHIQMITDSIGANALTALSFLWDAGISTALQSIPPTIDPNLFWAAGKLFALRTCNAPIIMLDTDFILWQPVTEQLDGHSLVAIHEEALDEHVYPNVALHQNPQHGSDCASLHPLNTAFCYFGDTDFLTFYTETAIAYMQNGKYMHDTLTDMVFAEQRLLSICAAQQGIVPHTLSTLDALFDPTQNQTFTHVWGHKQTLAQSQADMQAFCSRCAVRLMQDYPLEAKLLANIPTLRTYFA